MPAEGGWIGVAETPDDAGAPFGHHIAAWTVRCYRAALRRSAHDPEALRRSADEAAEHLRAEVEASAPDGTRDPVRSLLLQAARALLKAHVRRGFRLLLAALGPAVVLARARSERLRCHLSSVGASCSAPAAAMVSNLIRLRCVSGIAGATGMRAAMARTSQGRDHPPPDGEQVLRVAPRGLWELLALLEETISAGLLGKPLFGIDQYPNEGLKSFGVLTSSSELPFSESMSSRPFALGRV